MGFVGGGEEREVCFVGCHVGRVERGTIGRKGRADGVPGFGVDVGEDDVPGGRGGEEVTNGV